MDKGQPSSSSSSSSTTSPPELEKVISILRSGLQQHSWAAETIPNVLTVTYPSPCIRCALRLAGFRDESLFQAPLKTLRTAILSLNLNDLPDLTASAGESGGCRICLGILQDQGQGDTASLPLATGVLTRVVAALKKKGYVDVVQRGLTVCLGISLPACTTIRDRGCWEWLKEQDIVDKDVGEAAILDVKDVIKAALEKGVSLDLNLPLDQQSGSLKVSISYLHVEADKVDYELVVKRLIPHGKGQAFRRNNKRKRNQGTNEDNLCNTTLMNQVIKAADENPKGIIRWFGDLLPLETKVTTSIQMVREPIYLLGRYQKFCREMPQTAWTVDDKKMGKSSVEEVVVEPIKEFCGANSIVFMGAGREDIDVRMLGNGRPFLLQINDPRRTPHTSEEVQGLQDAVNAETGLNKDGDVKITGLSISDKSKVKEMHESAEDKEKIYSCSVWVSKPITQEVLSTKLESLKNLEIMQKTPIRVLHRRSLLERPRMIHEMKCETIREDPRRFLLHLSSSAGTYIKEFVHGDLGRTVPSVGTILDCDADIIQLDVTDVFEKGRMWKAS